MALSEDIDAVVIASMENPQGEYDSLYHQLDSDKIYTTPLLHIVRKRNGGSS